ncbi:hypothetical protein [Achromobacter marplatensis]
MNASSVDTEAPLGKSYFDNLTMEQDFLKTLELQVDLSEGQHLLAMA